MAAATDDTAVLTAMITAMLNDPDMAGHLADKVTAEFQMIRPSGNPANMATFTQMFASGDVVVTKAALEKIHKLEVCGDMAFACVTGSGAFTYKGTPNDDVWTGTLIFKRVDGAWLFNWMQRSTGDQKEAPEFDWPS